MVVLRLLCLVLKKLQNQSLKACLSLLQAVIFALFFAIFYCFFKPKITSHYRILTLKKAR
ncbi:hypothetical protein MHA_2085 [Mannheimia haemolytica PHL213]|nr:hypothetical protein MHA_2085 [Mannheimia haemolytica PHL213]